MTEFTTEARPLPPSSNGRMTRRSHPSLVNGVDAKETEKDLDSLVLSQALVDFEVANARVVDLTQRLMEATESRVASTGELTALRAQYEALAAEKARLAEQHQALTDEYERLLSTKAYKLVKAVWSVHRAFGR